ncbi:Sulfatase modifying factor 1 precursor (C-alpha-formyglycine- generating enzyme 1) [Fulvivirga imtechensis AK7]|uniref:Sulfatase modifying factor 1 (C-alpha-formyglycine-generating enzyme 1) n=2 Tax=Fulvivirga TaxID=396811 RepID=L8JMT1_9BACT|nr:Sulfatase modifying factor 1 precursor (C-alpha-formyglycine- generating enzyme 1) [Fulvivirga imtechensis AK7]
MVYFAGGDITIGSEHGLTNEAPTFEAEIAPFFIDKHPVTVAQFRAFVQTTGYKTDAEKFGNSALFNYKKLIYELVDSVTWQQPLGPNGAPAKDNHPITHVSWNDAMAYASWAGKRLPHEYEWEFAARNGKNTNDKYSWGNSLTDNNGVFKANVWQGHFPDTNTVADDFAHTSPVGAFGITSCGMSDMGGNVWEWCSNIFELYPGNHYPYQKDPNVKVIRGGSFMCDSLVCHGYRVSARQFTSRETSNFHMGFRCAMDVDRRTSNPKHQTPNQNTTIKTTYKSYLSNDKRF